MPSETPSSAKTLHTTCCIAGGGPAGMMLGYLLARTGVDVLVLEKHADFLRDFRGDTIHPSTLEVMKELGLLDRLLQQPHQKVDRLSAFIGGREYALADFSHLRVTCPYIAFMPQWDFLTFLATEAKRYPSFRLLMQARATGLIEEQGVIKGITATTPDGPVEIRATLTIGADGRHSTLREKAGFSVVDHGSPLDVLWMRISRQASDPVQVMGRFDRGRVFVMLYRGDYWQCAFVIPKGGFTALQNKGLDAFRTSIAEIAPALQDRVHEITSWEDVKLLTVTIDSLREWSRPGLLCIGDAAHAMSPIGGVGINLAIQDSVAAANILTASLKENRLTPADLRAVQKRRTLPTRLTQRLQILLQNTILGKAITTPGPFTPPLALRIILRTPFLQRLPTRFIGIGFRPEHPRTK